MIDFTALKDMPAEEVANLCAIDLNYMETTLQNHASLYAYAEASYETAEYTKAVAAVYLDRAKDDAFNTIQQDEPGLAIGKTDARVGAMEAVRSAQDHLLECSKDSGMLKALIKGLQHRKDMLIQISSRQKAEAAQY